jgi:hypothetical protein
VEGVKGAKMVTWRSIRKDFQRAYRSGMTIARNLYQKEGTDLGMVCCKPGWPVGTESF